MSDINVVPRPSTHGVFNIFYVLHDRLMNWPSALTDINTIENLWTILKRTTYADGRQFTSKDELWRASNTAAASAFPSTIKKLTESTDD